MLFPEENPQRFSLRWNGRFENYTFWHHRGYYLKSGVAAGGRRRVRAPPAGPERDRRRRGRGETCGPPAPCTAPGPDAALPLSSDFSHFRSQRTCGLGVKTHVGVPGSSPGSTPESSLLRMPTPGRSFGATTKTPLGSPQPTSECPGFNPTCTSHPAPANAHPGR